MNGLPSSRKPNRTALAAMAVLGVRDSALCRIRPGPGGAMSPYQDEKDGVSAGGKWMKFQSEDKMTGAKKVRFELLSNNYFKRRSRLQAQSRTDLRRRQVQTGRLQSRRPACLRPTVPASGASLSWKSEVRIDDVHDYHGWNWERGHFLSMDKGTTRGLIGAQVFNVAAANASRPRRSPSSRPQA